MNLFLKKAAAFIAAGLIATAGIGAECFAEGAKLTETNVELNFAAAVAKPTYTVKGTPGVRKVRLSTATAGATIYYTTNGTVPTTKSKVYTGALIQLTSDTKIKAIAVKGGVSSAVMTKTFRITTMYGDVTGDGQINTNDYNRLKNYIMGQTKFICKDNADCNGSGGISSADLSILGQYINGTITSLPYKAATSVKKPTASMRKVYGGLQITFTPKTAGSQIYYTTNGTTPTSDGTRYTTPFTVSETSQIKAIAYLNGETSGVFSFTASVGTLPTVQADKSTDTAYTGEISVSLYTGNSAARIIYTLDGSDPRTSLTANLYTNPIKISSTTTIKAYAQAKAYANSDVSTFTYNVDSVYTISGYVWDDTSGSTPTTTSTTTTTTTSNTTTVTTANGVMSSDETGIAGIPVYLIASTTSATDAPTLYIQKQLTDSTGRYAFSNLSKNTPYKVVFEYNCQKYRAYSSIVSGGNQALPYKTLDPIIVRTGGAYTKATGTLSGETLLNSVNKYSDAINSSYYKMYAITTNTYSETTNNVNFALVSKNYGILDLSISVTGQDTATNTTSNGKRLVYTVKLTNNSPLSLTTLDQASVEVKITNAFDGYLNFNQKTSSNKINQSFTSDGNLFFIWSDFITNSLAPGKSVELQFEGYVSGADKDTKIECVAQVLSYKFSPNCYDYYSIPGNMANNKVKERDEAAATVITVQTASSSSTTTAKDLKINPSGTMQISVGGEQVYYINIINGAGTETVQIIHNNSGIISYTLTKSDSTTYVLKLTGLTAGTDSLTVQLVDGNTILKQQQVNISVKA